MEVSYFDHVFLILFIIFFWPKFYSASSVQLHNILVKIASRVNFSKQAAIWDLYAEKVRESKRESKREIFLGNRKQSLCALLGGPCYGLSEKLSQSLTLELQQMNGRSFIP